MTSPDKAQVPGLVPSSSASVTSPSENEKYNRVARAAIAAQACETCRARKSKCDEQRPKCSLCKRLNVECRYREPQPTKKDKSIEQMMTQLNRMEQKLNAIGTVVNPRSQLFDFAAQIHASSAASGIGMPPLFSPAHV